MAPLESQPMSTPAPKKKLRYRLYFWLMDLSLFFAVIGLVDWLLGRIWTMTLLPKDSIPYFIVFILVGIFNVVVPGLLLVGRFMRDEYAEFLWQRAVRVLAYTTSLIPFCLFILTWIAQLSGYDAANHAQFGILFRQVPIIWALLVAWFAYQLLFVLIFQIVRWRDGR
jgi:hypothetical protein